MKLGKWDRREDVHAAIAASLTRDLFESDLILVRRNVVSRPLLAMLDERGALVTDPGDVLESVAARAARQIPPNLYRLGCYGDVPGGECFCTGHCSAWCEVPREG